MFCMNVCKTPRVFLVPSKARRGCLTPGTGVRKLSAMMWLLGIEPQSLQKQPVVLSPCPLSSPGQRVFLTTVHTFLPTLTIFCFSELWPSSWVWNGTSQWFHFPNR